MTYHAQNQSAGAGGERSGAEGEADSRKAAIQSKSLRKTHFNINAGIAIELSCQRATF